MSVHLSGLDSIAFGERFLARKPRSVDLTQVSEWDDGAIRRKEDYLAAEEPLEIRIGENSTDFKAGRLNGMFDFDGEAPRLILDPASGVVLAHQPE